MTRTFDRREALAVGIAFVALRPRPTPRIRVDMWRFENLCEAQAARLAAEHHQVWSQALNRAIRAFPSIADVSEVHVSVGEAEVELGIEEALHRAFGNVLAAPPGGLAESARVWVLAETPGAISRAVIERAVGCQRGVATAVVRDPRLWGTIVTVVGVVAHEW